MTFELTQEELDNINIANESVKSFRQLENDHIGAMYGLMEDTVKRIMKEATPDEIRKLLHKIEEPFYRSELRTFANQQEKSWVETQPNI